MNPTQIKLVQDSFAKVAPISEQAAVLFYGRLFEVAPSVRAMFPDDMKEQRKKLMATLAVVVGGLSNLEAVLPAASALAKRHVNYGAKAEHYPVVGGALLAENAGAALEEIEQVSNQIASLVQNISASARQQAAASGNISKNMQVVREISSQTAESSTATSTSIAKLAALSAQLRKSVAGFRLPDFGGAAGAGATSTKLPALAEPATPVIPGKMRKASGIGA